MKDAILDQSLGLIGDFPLPQDLWDLVVPEFYRDILRSFKLKSVGKTGNGWCGGRPIGFVTRSNALLPHSPPHMLPVRDP